MSTPLPPAPQFGPPATFDVPPPSVLDYPILFVPEAAAAAVQAAARNRTGRIVSLVISVAILVALYMFFLDTLGGISWPFVLLAVAMPIVLLVLAIVREVRVRRDARTVSGLALGVTRTGLVSALGWTPWVAVASLMAAPGRAGSSAQLVVTSVDGRSMRLPMAYLSVLPANVDNAIATLSDGRWRVDFTKLGV